MSQFPYSIKIRCNTCHQWGKKRVGLDDLSIRLSKEQFRYLLIAERGWGFIGAEPAARWFGLQRTGSVAKADSNRNAIENHLMNTK